MPGAGIWFGVVDDDVFALEPVLVFGHCREQAAWGPWQFAHLSLDEWHSLWLWSPEHRRHTWEFWQPQARWPSCWQRKH